MGNGGGVAPEPAAGLRAACEAWRRRLVSLLVIPGGSVVGLRRRVETRVQTIFRQFETFLHDEGGVGVVDEVILRDAIVFDRVAERFRRGIAISAPARI